jgi:hypothetical protein
VGSKGHRAVADVTAAAELDAVLAGIDRD